MGTRQRLGFGALTLATLASGALASDTNCFWHLSQDEKEAQYKDDLDNPNHPLRSENNHAFLFIKPHALKGQSEDAVTLMVKATLMAAGISIDEEGDINAEEIDEKKLIDTHYGAIAAKAVILKPRELNVPDKGKAGFEKMFGLTWDDAVAQGKVYNAADAAALLGVDGAGLEGLWRGLTHGKDLIKFGGGFYCGKVGDIYIMNGFYMSMRSDYCAPGEKIHYMTVHWDPRKLSWGDFRGQVLGATDPSEAPKGSVRRVLAENAESLGLAPFNTGANGVHASASPLEAMAERKNWLADREYNYVNHFNVDRFQTLSGKDDATIAEWEKDCQASFDGGNPGSVFDLMEDKDTFDVVYTGLSTKTA